MRRHERGAALIETALALPVILLALYGVTWGIRAGTVLERSETAVRYAGVVSAQANPWHDYSLYALYNNLGTNSGVETSLCTPPSGLYLTGGTLPVVIPGTAENQNVIPGFWTPDRQQPGCDSSTAERQYFNGPSRAYLLLQSVPQMSTFVSDGGFLGTSQLFSQMSTEDRFYRSPDMATLMHCAASLNTAISASLQPKTYGANNGVSAPLAVSDFRSTPLALDANCATGIGAQTPIPVPSITPFIPGNTPVPPVPGPGSSGSPEPSANPTVTPAPGTSPSGSPSAGPSPSSTGPPASPTPAPTKAPGPTPSPTKAPSPTPSPTKAPSPTPSPTKAPSPTPKPTTPPTKAPSPTPKPTTPPTKAPTPTPKPTTPPTKAPTPKPTPTPTKAPTPKPTTKPTTSPTTKPNPTPAPSGTPGGIS